MDATQAALARLRRFAQAMSAETSAAAPSRRAVIAGALRLALVLSVIAIAGACRRGGAGAPDAATLRIAVVPKGTTHEFWKAVHAGAVQAARETGVEIVWKGPLKEDDRKGQIDLVQSFVAQGVSGIVLAPLDDRALEPPVRDAVRARIPVVVFDSDLAGGAHASFVATDNVAAGRLAGEALARRLGGTGRVVLLRYQEGSASTTNRERGFLDAVRAHAGIQVASDNQYGGATTESAHATAENLLAAQRAASGGVHGVFCPNESTTFGMLIALRKAGLAGKVRFVGFDSSEKLVRALRDGEIDGLVVQNPMRIGRDAVRTMVDHLRGRPVPARIDTGATFVDRESMDRPEIREILQPDLEKWLGK